MSFGSYWRQYRPLVFLFSFCLSIVLLAGEATSMQPALPNSSLTSVDQKTLSQQQLNPIAQAPPLTTTQDVRKTVLDNGLTVLTKEVHTAPVVSVQVWYRVGARNEAPGVNGIAHQLEHMLFKGTLDRPIQFGRLFSALGSQSNAFTSYDQTAYFNTVERDKLKALLILEADRMQNALIDAEQLASEKRVVISELQGYENDPSYRLSRAVMQAAFPNHPYGLPVGGTKADVQRFTVEQVRDYYRQYYSPDNSVLVIVGDFQTEPTLKLVREIFGQVPKSSKEAVSSPTSPTFPATPATSPIVLREPGSAPLLQAVYRLPSINHPDVPALKVMDYVLTGGRNSRLYQALVESGLASDFEGYAANLIELGWYEVLATATPNTQLTQIDQVLQEAIANLQTQGVTPEELKRAKAQLKAGTILGNRDITSQALQLGDDLTVAGDYRYTDRLLAAIEQVSAAQVQQVAQKYLTPANRTLGFFEPTQVTASAAPGGSNPNQTLESFNAGPPVDPAEVAKYLPAIESSSLYTDQALPQQLTLGNGLKVLLLGDNSTPTMTLNGYVRAGKEFDPDAKAGLAEITADNLMNGTKTKDALALAEALEEKGANLSFAATREGVTIDGSSLAADLPILIQTLADVLQNATFPADQLALSLERSLTQLKAQLDDPSYLGYRTLQQTIYPANHPFHTYPTRQSLRRITPADLQRFYQAHYRPERTVLTLVGDFDPAQVRSLLEQQFGNWKASGKPPEITFPPVPMPQKLLRLNAVIPGKTEAITYMGSRGIDREDPRYYAALVLNEIVGGDTLASRLGTEIRDRQGLSYGIYSYFQTGKQPGLFLINMQTSPEDSQKAIASILALLQQIHQQGVSNAEVEAAKRSLISRYTVSLADPNSLTSEILMNEVYGLSPEEIRNFPSKIQAITLEQVNRVAKELLLPDRLVVVTAGPAIGEKVLSPES